uniref:SERPIN domain-containing protein n=1 Tax=Strongyloides papillosus TaxID=174720 RepID=A0A0N5CH50_STREA
MPSTEQNDTLEAQANFTIDALKYILTPKDAVVFSPYSLILSMAIGYIGARGRTEAEYKNLLSPYTKKEEYCRILENSIDDILHDSNESRSIYIANGIFIKNGYIIKEKFKDDIRIYLTATFESTNFSDPEKSAKIINDFISNATNHEIKDLVKPNSISMNTKSILINALYFKSQWKLLFDESLTTDEEFYITSNEKKIVKMMNITSLFSYGGDNDFHVVQKSYWNYDNKFILILPKERNNLHSLLKKMDGKGLLKLIKSANCCEEVIFSMPKFRVESTHNMKSILTKMGLVTPFNENANFTGITSTGKFWVEDASQKVLVDVNEKGTEVVAVTNIPCGGYSPNKDREKIIVKADHPFLYIILKNEEILFIGVYQ